MSGPPAPATTSAPLHPSLLRLGKKYAASEEHPKSSLLNKEPRQLMSPPREFPLGGGRMAFLSVSLPSSED